MSNEKVEKKLRGEQNSSTFAPHHSRVIDKEFQPFLSNVSSNPLPAKKKVHETKSGGGGSNTVKHALNFYWMADLAHKSK